MLRWFSSWFVLLFSLSAAFSASAVQRTFVSISGSDANTVTNCGNATPCRGFTAALTVTDSGGEIIVQSSGGYGPVTIDKSVSIIAREGIYAGISVFSGNGITIATAGVKVVLRGLSVNRLGGSGSGISMTAGDSLVVQHCVISNFSSSNGLYVSGAVTVRLLDSLLQGNNVGAFFVNGPSVLVSGSRFIDNADSGLSVFALGSGVTTKLEVNRSEASGNGSAGINGWTGSSGRWELNVKDSVASRNGHGIYARSNGGTTLASVTGSLISGNTSTGLTAEGSGTRLVATANTVTHNSVFGLCQTSSAVFESTGDNTVRDNTNNSFGTITTISRM